MQDVGNKIFQDLRYKHLLDIKNVLIYYVQLKKLILWCVMHEIHVCDTDSKISDV